jgi:hypothetical protein
MIKSGQAMIDLFKFRVGKACCGDPQCGEDPRDLPTLRLERSGDSGPLSGGSYDSTGNLASESVRLLAELLNAATCQGTFSSGLLGPPLSLRRRSSGGIADFPASRPRPK